MESYETVLAECRRLVVSSIVERRSGHLCSSLSILDILVSVLLREWDNDTRSFNSDVVLSKGHAAPALYAVLSLLDDTLPPLPGALRRLTSPYEGHPARRLIAHVPVSTGALGLGLAWSVGRAIALEREGSSRRVIALVSDGELQCGVSYEALRLAAIQRAKNLTIIVDHNRWQTDGPLRDDPEGLLNALGFDVHSFDGHRQSAIEDALRLTSDSTMVLVGETLRCAGLSARYLEGPEVYGESIDDSQAFDLLTEVGVVTKSPT